MVDSEKQIGGRHYKGTKYEHWDFVLRTGMDYLAGNATKYIARYLKKGAPVQDLEKALHYVEKLQENAGLILSYRLRLPREWVSDEAQKFCDANQLDGDIRTVIVLLTTWVSSRELALVKTKLSFMLAELAASYPNNWGEPVPLEDSNKHADRSIDAQ